MPRARPSGAARSAQGCATSASAPTTPAGVLVTDHRIGLTLYKLDQVLDGDLDEIIDALTLAGQAEKLRASAEEA